MRLSQLFTKTSKTVPADETARNAQLLIKAGFIYKVMAGVYAYTPLGLRVVENIKQIVREEMNAIGGQELIMTNLQPQEPWAMTTRWDEKIVDVWFKTKLQDGTELGLAWSHEEAILDMMRQFVKSYKDLPIYAYQFQTKLRNELRAKSGIMRGREFVMKDMYSLCTDADQHEQIYQACIDAYKRIFDKLGIGDITYVTFASGGAFTKFSHEFQTICDAGEDVIYLHREKNIAVNEEVLDEENLQNLGIKREELEEVKSAEVGNIFNFGTEKAEQMGVTFMDKEGKQQPVFLGSYGIGVTRLMGVIAELMSDDKGLVWPENIAPARVYIAQLGVEGSVVTAAEQLYEKLSKNGIEAMYDDRDVRPGQKMADADLLGMPYRVVVSQKTVADGVFEIKKRTENDVRMMNIDGILEFLSNAN